MNKSCLCTVLKLNFLFSLCLLEGGMLKQGQHMCSNRRITTEKLCNMPYKLPGMANDVSSEVERGHVIFVCKWYFG